MICCCAGCPEDAASCKPVGTCRAVLIGIAIAQQHGLCCGSTLLPPEIRMPAADTPADPASPPGASDRSGPGSAPSSASQQTQHVPTGREALHDSASGSAPSLLAVAGGPHNAPQPGEAPGAAAPSCKRHNRQQRRSPGGAGASRARGTDQSRSTPGVQAPAPSAGPSSAPPEARPPRSALKQARAGALVVGGHNLRPVPKTVSFALKRNRVLGQGSDAPTAGLQSAPHTMHHKPGRPALGPAKARKVGWHACSCKLHYCS